MGWIGCICCKKFRHDFVAWTFALIAPVQPILHRVSCSNEMVPNAPKHYETQQKLSLGSNGVDQVRSLQKHPTQLCGTNFCINWTSSAHFALSLLSWQNNPKCTQTLRNATKVEFRIQWGGLGALVAKKLERDFVARTFALIAPVQPILHWVYFVALSLGSNGVDWVRSLCKHLMRLCGTNFWINCTSSAHFALSFMQ